MRRLFRQMMRACGYDVVRRDPRQVGKDPLADMARFLRTDRPVIFDVGANVGQTIERFRARFPGCVLHSFEPSPTTYGELSRRAAALPDVHLWNCALGSVPGQRTFLENSHSDMSSFLPPSTTGWGTVVRETVVEVRTIDQICRDGNIERIDILKSDTQGFDLEVFAGAGDALRAGKIGMIYCEIIFSDMYQNLPSLSAIHDFLARRDFLLVSFYEFHYQRQLASWTDALYVHKSQSAVGE